tara:strand:- start:884 stop:1549 length:666 start_codon:yes stop_codon:yes gene_type:complete
VEVDSPVALDALDATSSLCVRLRDGVAVDSLVRRRRRDGARPRAGSGKTYTMNGPPDNRGCNLRALHDLFVKSRERRQDGIVDTIKVSVLEIYNESIRDLLRDPSKGAKKLEVRRGERGNYVPDLTSVEVHDDNEVIELMEMADGVRAASSTDMNEHSSRSHMLLSVYVDTVHKSSAVRTFSRLHLAGSGADSLDDDSHAIVAPRAPSLWSISATLARTHA